MNQQNRRAKRAAQLSEQLFLCYFVRFNQPQHRDAIVAEICANGVMAQVPYFDVKLPIRFVSPQGDVEPWVTAEFGAKTVVVQTVQTGTNQIADNAIRGVSGTKTTLTVTDETGRILVTLKLYQTIRVSLTAVVVNRNTNKMDLCAALINETPQNQDDSEPSLKQLLQECNAVNPSDRKKDYFEILEEEALPLEKTRGKVLETAKTLLGGNDGGK